MTDTYVTRIARRHARPGLEAEYEAGLKTFFEAAKTFPGFRGAEVIPPAEPGGSYQVMTHFENESDFAAWDHSAARAKGLTELRKYAADEPEYRRLTGLEAFFSGPVVPASVKPPREKMAVLTWLGIWPIASFLIWFVSPVLGRLGLPFLLITAINVALITLAMTYLVMPNLTKLFRGWLNPTK